MPKKKLKFKGKLEKPEDKAWCEWYNTLGKEENKKLLKQLGFNESDLEELNEMHGKLGEIQEGIESAGTEPKSKGSRKTKGKKKA